MQRAVTCGLVVCAALVCMSTDAHAQYKNLSWGFYAGSGFWLPSENVNYYSQQDLINAGQLVDPATGGSVATGTPYSLINPSLKLEFNFKISDSFTWWFKTGLDISLLRLVSDQRRLDGSGAGGAALFLELTAGPRVYFLTDNIRPFLEIGVRIPIPGAIIFSTSSNFIPQNVKSFPGIYGTLGLEFFVARDFALSISGSYTRFIVINFPGFNSIDAKFGVLIYM